MLEIITLLGLAGLTALCYHGDKIFAKAASNANQKKISKILEKLNINKVTKIKDMQSYWSEFKC